MADLNIERLRAIMQDFYTLTHMRIGLLDCDNTERLSYPGPRCAFCDFIRRNPELDARCRQCDDSFFRKCRANAAPLVYTCHAGLIELIIPIRTSNNILCYIMAGQVVDEAHADEQRHKIYEDFCHLGLDNDELRRVIGQIDCRSQQEFSASATVLESLALYFLTKRIIAPSRIRFIESLNGFIDEHLREPILIADLCRHFHVSRTRLYEQSRPYLDCSLADYVQRRRVHHAKQLLQSTDLPIAEIAAAVGFEDYNYFRRVFKQLDGRSARECRLAGSAGAPPAEDSAK